MNNQSGNESPHSLNGHTPDGSSGASQLGQGMSFIQLWLSRELWQGHIDWFNTCEAFKAAAGYIGRQPVGRIDEVYIDGIKLSRSSETG
jgi:hypothetical protein